MFSCLHPLRRVHPPPLWGQKLLAVCPSSEQGMCPELGNPWGSRGRNGLCKSRVGNTAVSVSAVVAWRKPRQGSDPDVLGCLQMQNAGGFSWVRHATSGLGKMSRIGSERKKCTKFSVKIDISIYSWVVMILQNASSSSRSSDPFC